VEKSLYCRIAVSRFHGHLDVDFFVVAKRSDVQVDVGSALVYRQLAIVVVDVFPGLVSISEWDAAVGQVMLEEAGSQVVDWCTGKDFRHGQHNAEIRVCWRYVHRMPSLILN